MANVRKTYEIAVGREANGSRRVGMIEQSLRIGVAAILLAVTLAGCGVRGALDGPSAKSASASGAASTAAKSPGEPAEKPKHRDFILDGLIR